MEWVSISSDLRGCTLKVWHGHLIAMAVNDGNVMIIKHAKTALLRDESKQVLGPFNINDEVYGKLEIDTTDKFLIVSTFRM
jgi:hypothetical protein